MIEFLPKEANLPLLIGRCISILHACICKRKVKGLGVTLPAWSEKTIGNKIAFVHSDESVLNSLKLQPYFKEMNDYRLFKLSDVSLAPDDCSEVRFKRNQSIAKIFVGESRRRLKRLEKRALARGENFISKKSHYSRELDIFHRIPTSSNSKKTDFIQHIQKENVNCKEAPNFTSYGFATNVIQNGTVPDLSNLS
jgi:CRISPR-associated endonuclease Csy4